MADSISAPRATFLVRIIWYWIPVLMTVAAMYYFSTDVLSSSHTQSVIDKVLLRFLPHASNHALGIFNFVVRKSAHVFEYTVLGALLFRAFRGDSQVRWQVRWAFYALVSAALWAMLDEFHQTFTRSRDGSIWDVLLDSCGALLALTIIASYITRGQAPRSSTWTRRATRRNGDSVPLE
jgi:VanZ family protein